MFRGETYAEDFVEAHANASDSGFVPVNILIKMSSTSASSGLGTRY